MKIYALSDFHLSFMVDKPMDVFGEKWNNYEEKIKNNWQNKVKAEDIVLISGDTSWAMYEKDTEKDFEFISKLNGKKVIIRGNHDYWWKSISGVRELLPNGVFALQNDSIMFENYLICGTRGWLVPEHGKTLNAEDQKIYDREVIRLELALKDMQQKRKEDSKVICMMHFPPFNSKMEESEFTKLFKAYNVDKVVYAHLHKKTINPKKITLDGIEYILSSSDLVDFDPVEVY